MAKDSENVDIDVRIEAITTLAMLVWDGKRTVWIPRSQLVGFDWGMSILTGLTETTITIPEWLAKEKGLI